MPSPTDVILFPDAGPLITLANGDALDLLLKPGWTVSLVDMVLHEVTRNRTPTSLEIDAWVSNRAYLLFLEEKGLIESAAEIERKAVRNGRQFSNLRFPRQ